MFEINLPEVVAEVRAAHEAYEKALTVNDLETMDTLFWNSEHTVRHGPTGSQYGHAQISQYRKGPPKGQRQRLYVNLVITTFGTDFATTNAEYTYPDSPATGRRAQAWIRTQDGWRIASAHVSDIELG